MHKLLSELRSPTQLSSLSVSQLEELADEIRDVLCNLLSERSAHFASNLGVVELCLALHSVFDFSQDRLIWDTGHQIYPHKLITGRYDEFHTIRTKGGLMGYPNPEESSYDLFMTGHAGTSISTMLGLRVGDDLLDQSDRRAVAVIGDGAFPSGVVYEAMNNTGGLKKNLLVILNDNKMSICPRVGGMANYLDRLRTNPYYTGLKTEVVKMLNRVPLFGDPTERLLAQIKEGVKAGLHGGMLFEDLASCGSTSRWSRTSRSRCCCTLSPKRDMDFSRRRRTRSIFTRLQPSCRRMENRYPRAHPAVALTPIVPGTPSWMP